MYKGVYTRDGEAISVAIKTMKGLAPYLLASYTYITIITDTSLLKTEEFLKECNTAKQFNHPNIMSLIGISIIPGERTPLMVLPYMHHGDVKSFVKSKRGTKIELDEFPKVVYHYI